MPEKGTMSKGTITKLGDDERAGGGWGRLQNRRTMTESLVDNDRGTVTKQADNDRGTVTKQADNDRGTVTKQADNYRELGDSD